MAHRRKPVLRQIGINALRFLEDWISVGIQDLQPKTARFDIVFHLASYDAGVAADASLHIYDEGELLVNFQALARRMSRALVPMSVATSGSRFSARSNVSIEARRSAA